MGPEKLVFITTTLRPSPFGGAFLHLRKVFIMKNFKNINGKEFSFKIGPGEAVRVGNKLKIDLFSPEAQVTATGTKAEGQGVGILAELLSNSPVLVLKIVHEMVRPDEAEADFYSSLTGETLKIIREEFFDEWATFLESFGDRARADMIRKIVELVSLQQAELQAAVNKIDPKKTVEDALAAQR